MKTPEYYKEQYERMVENRRRVDDYLTKIGFPITWESRFHVFGKNFYKGFRLPSEAKSVKLLDNDGKFYLAYHISEVMTETMRKGLKYIKLSHCIKYRIDCNEGIKPLETWEDLQ